jgi:hypothetical protein
MEYSYSINPFNLNILNKQIEQSNLSQGFHGSRYDGVNVVLCFSGSLSSQQQLDLDSLVESHSSGLNSNFDYLFESSANSQESDIGFSRQLLHDWMRKNKLEGMSINQSLWVFSRFEEFEINAVFGAKHVDIFKMFYSGAIPTVYYCILRVAPDPMTESYHWLTQARLDWVKGKLEEYLGAGMSAYIQSLP